MFRVYWCLSHEHDLRLVALAFVVCGLASFTAVLLVARTISTGGQRRGWLTLAGVVTGIGIWSTHYTAMLGFSPVLPIRFDPRAAAVSILATVLLSVAGWVIAAAGGTGRGWRGSAAAGGLIVGLGLAVAHYVDMDGLIVAGRIVYDFDLVAVSIVAGLFFCGLTGWLLQRGQTGRYRVLAGLSLSAGVLLLHFIGMAALRILPDPTIVVAASALGLDQLGGLVIAGTVAVLCVALAVAVYDDRMIRQSARAAERLAASSTALRLSEEHYRFAVEFNPQIPWVSDVFGMILEIGPLAADVTGVPIDNLLGRGWMRYVHPEDIVQIGSDSVNVWHRRGSFDHRYRVRQTDGSYRWSRARGTARRGPDRSVMLWYGSLEDIDDQVTAENALRLSEERYRLALGATNEAIWDWHHATDRIDWGEAVGSQLGYPEAQAGTSQGWWVDRVHPDDFKAARLSLEKALGDGSTLWGAEYRFRKGDGTYADIYSRGKIVRDANGTPIRTVGAMLDITERKRTEESLRWRAMHDPLTDLPNRTLFNQRLTDALQAAKMKRHGVGLIVLDVDDFKMVNDTFGHPTGDALLCLLAQRLRRIVPADAVVARLGGDEFAVILPKLETGEALIDVIGRALAGLNVVFDLEGRAIECNTSVGGAMWPGDGSNAEELLKSADIALNTAKSEDRASIRTFSGDMRVLIETRATMLTEARGALKDDRIVPFYQPKIDLVTGEIAGFEALLRWNHHRNGLQPPNGIAAAFEDIELSGRLTDRMIDRVVRDMQDWQHAGVDFRKIAINGSAADFLRGDFSDRLLGALHQADISPTCFEIEVTETVFVGRVAKNVERTLNDLSAAGVTVALDDFGTGYASLSHLRQFPVDVIKIDQSFVHKLARIDDDDVAIIQAVIALAKSLDLVTVAEGVETDVQATQLRAEGCDLAQGYLFSRAVAAFQVAKLVARRPASFAVASRLEPDAEPFAKAI
ncbi:EAL domain-containing protein [Sphingosinicellaceae bacterium]|nr:EAL domain-containing protein [Sphingosinicellaceae bacterium]